MKTTTPYLPCSGPHDAGRPALRRHGEVGDLCVVAPVRYRSGAVHVAAAADGAQQAVAREYCIAETAGVIGTAAERRIRNEAAQHHNAV